MWNIRILVVTKIVPTQVYLLSFYLICHEFGVGKNNTYWRAYRVFIVEKPVTENDNANMDSMFSCSISKKSQPKVVSNTL